MYPPFDYNFKVIIFGGRSCVYWQPTMVNLSYIDTVKSIETGRLVAKRDWLVIVDRIVFSVLMVLLIAYLSLIYFHEEIKNSNEKVVGYFVFPIIILFDLYSLYRKLTETSLTSIDTVLSGYRNKELLLEFLKQNEYDVFLQSKDIVIARNEESLSFSNIWTKTITFIITDRKIYFNIAKKYPKLNPPVLFTHLFLRAGLKKFFKDKNN